jgi:hypothetical protein
MKLRFLALAQDESLDWHRARNSPIPETKKDLVLFRLVQTGRRD